MFYREVKANETSGSTSLNAGDFVFVSIASVNPNVNSVSTIALIVIWGRAFARLTTIDPSRPRDNYIRGDVLTWTLGAELVYKIVAKVPRLSPS